MYPYLYWINCKKIEVNDLGEQPIVVSLVTDELRIKQHHLDTTEVDKIKRLNGPHDWS